MNHTYLQAWNKEQDRCMHTAESVHRCGKPAGLRALSAAVIASMAVTAHALPGGGQVSAGQGSIAQSGSAMKVTQQSQNLAINWQSFGIRANESVVFAQPNASAIALNRVLGSGTSQIFGRLSANGQVWILNPNGVLFGSGAQVSVGGLLASTLSISDTDFLAGKRTFTGNGGTVTNQGSIKADGGYVALLGGRVSNEGTIQARLGTVALAAGKQVTLDFAGDKLLKLQVDRGAIDALAQNKQLIQVDGGSVLLTARAADAVLSTVVNNEGIIEAHTIDTRNGSIRLIGGMNGGTVKVGGTLDASTSDRGDGGFIETSGAHVNVSDSSRITTVASSGKTGQWLIGPASFTIAASGGDITGKALAKQMGSTNVTVRSTSGAADGSGDVNVNDSIAWASTNGLTLSALGNVKIAKAVSNSGAGGVTLRADNTGACVAGAANCGTVSFSDLGHVSVNGGAVNIFYNPAGTNNAADADGNGPSYATPTDYSGKVTLNLASSLSAWMLVNDVNQLQAINTNQDGRYALGRDVDAAATGAWNGGAGFMPISYFAGHFDGGGHVVSELTIDRPSTDNVGLFGHLDYASSVSNVGLSGGSVIGNYYVGGVAGSSDGTITNSNSSARVNGYFSAGGLVGSNNGTIDNSYGTGNVSGFQTLGGLVGSNNGAIDNSYGTGNVSGSAYQGGLVGENFGTVSNSYGTGNITGDFDLGGLAGNNLGTVSNSYSTGNVSGGPTLGGLVGFNFGTISGSHSTGNVKAVDSIYGSLFQGGLVGWNYIGAIRNSYSSGNVSGGDTVGGLVGNNNATISSSYSTGNVSGVGVGVGGLVGNNGGGIVSNSHSSGFVNGAENVGGLVGSNFGTISNGNSTGNVSGGIAVGGLVGYNIGTITRSYSTGNVTGDYNLGGLFGVSEGAINNSHYNIDTVTINGDLHVTEGGLYTAQFKKWLSSDKTLPSINNYLRKDDNGYYMLGSTMDLKNLLGFVDNPNYKFRLTNSLDMTTLPDWHIPVFTGTEFDGGGNTLDRLLVSQPFNSNIGFIGRLGDSSTVTGLGLTNVSVMGKDNVGGLIGASFGTISNSYSNGSVSGSGGVGGLVGYNIGSVRNSYSTGDVSGFQDIGGLIGQNHGMIDTSYSTGNVSGAYYVGGLIGGSDGTINGSYSTGSVGGDFSVGGLVGWNDGTINNSYSTGNVSGGDTIGGLIGGNGGVISNSYSTGAVTGFGGEVGGFGGWNAGAISNSYSTGSVSGYRVVGGLVGNNYNGGDISNYGTINNSYSTGNVSGGDTIGGLVGTNFGSIGNSYSTANVTGDSAAGGLVGYNFGSIDASSSTGNVRGGDFYYLGGLAGVNAGTISRSFSSGSVRGGIYAGGLVGGNTGSISNSYSTGNVIGELGVGGLVAWNDGSISNSYSTGNVSGGSYVGGLIGVNFGTISNSYWDIQTSGTITAVVSGDASGATGLNTSEMKQQANFIGFDFSNTWGIIEGVTYPFLLAP